MGEKDDEHEKRIQLVQERMVLSYVAQTGEQGWRVYEELWIIWKLWQEIAKAINMKSEGEGHSKHEGGDYWRVHLTFHQICITEKCENLIVIK